MQINKISGMGCVSNVSFSGKKTGPKSTKTNTVLDLEKEQRMEEVSYIMAYGKPKRVAFVYDKDYTFAVAKLFNSKDRCFYETEVPDERVEDCKNLLMKNGLTEKDILEVRYGGAAYKKDTNPFEETKKPSPEEAAARKALILMQHAQENPTVLRCPVTFRDNNEKYKMSYSDFLIRTYNTRFEFNKVLDNLNDSTSNSFTRDTIDSIIVTPDGTMMEIRAKDGKRAFMDFNTGKRRVFDNDQDSTGFGTIMIMDTLGPVIRKPDIQEKKTPNPKTTDENNGTGSLSSRLLEYFGISTGKHYKK